MEEKDQRRSHMPEESLEAEKGLSRRKFFKAGAIGATLGVAALTTNKKAIAAKTAQAAVTKEHEDFPLEVLDSYRPFPQKDTIFCRAIGQKEAMFRPMYKGLVGPYAALWGKGDRSILEREPGWGPLEIALKDACTSVMERVAPRNKFGGPGMGMYEWEGEISSVRHRFKNRNEATKVVKKAAKTFGASLVGISKFDPRWNYGPLYDPFENKEISPDDFPFKPKSVISIALEMDYDRIETSPSWVASSTAGQEYSRMATVSYSLATFLRSLGYRSFASGNDTGLSVPYAVAAGLGELGRNGLLVTYEYGPRVRLCRVYTELELEFDKPKTFGVEDFCRRCMRCADACPSKAISKDVEPGFEAPNKSCNPGVKKWYTDAEKCFKYWGEIGTGCTNCIASCPYNKPDFWHHKMVVWATKAAPGPLHSLMREMDIVFGYGNSFDKKVLRQWWDQ